LRRPHGLGTTGNTPANHHNESTVTAIALFHSTCGARLRRRAGTCQRLVKAPNIRCPVHNGGELTDEGRAIISTVAKARHAKQARAVHRGEATRFPQGRRKKWIIPRWWRYRLSEAEEATVLAHMVAHDARAGIERPPWQAVASQREEAKALASLERTWVIRLNSPDRPRADEVERLYDLIRGEEHALGLPGMDVRLNRLAWERGQFILRTALAPTRDPAAGAAVAHVESADFRHLHEISQPASPFEPANDPPVESEAECRNRELAIAMERTAVIVKGVFERGNRLRAFQAPSEAEPRYHKIR
jgi:hypothetical protein